MRSFPRRPLPERKRPQKPAGWWPQVGGKRQSLGRACKLNNRIATGALIYVKAALGSDEVSSSKINSDQFAAFIENQAQ
jgi:hypothetical protein